MEEAIYRGEAGLLLLPLYHAAYVKAIPVTGSGIRPHENARLSLPGNQCLFLNGIYHYQLIFLFPLSTPESQTAGESFNAIHEGSGQVNKLPQTHAPL